MKYKINYGPDYLIQDLEKSHILGMADTLYRSGIDLDSYIDCTVIVCNQGYDVSLIQRHLKNAITLATSFKGGGG